MTFWETKSLKDMNQEEWESLCDGCGRCCLAKLEDIDSGEISYTNVACGMLNIKTCSCTNYPERQRYMPDCVALNPQNVAELKWMPTTCAYRLLANGEPLPTWHPLITGTRESVIAAGISVKDWAIAEQDAGDLEDHIIEPPA